MKFLFGFILLFMLHAGIAFAQTTPPAPPGDITPPGTAKTVTLNNPLEADNIIELFETIIDIVLIFAVPLIVFFIIYAGFLYVTARGNEGTIEKAHKALLYALIGGLLILGARVLIDVVQGTVDCVRDLENECE
jgi:hypothetical protein